MIGSARLVDGLYYFDDNSLRNKTTHGTSGKRPIHQHRTAPKSAFDSSSNSDDDTKFMYVARESSSKPEMKKLLVDAFPKETEHRRGSPSVLGRLMGLNGLPCQHSLLRRRHRLDGIHHCRNMSSGFENDGDVYKDRLRRGSSMEHIEFKDVYEDLDASRIANSKLKQKMSFDKQNIMGANRIYTDERRRHSNELQERVETSGSSRGLIREFLRQPDSLFVKHVLDSSRQSPITSHIAILRPSNSVKYEGNAKRWNLDEETSRRRHYQERRDGLLHVSSSGHGAHISQNSSQIRSEGRHAGPAPVTIVILEPNPRKTSSAVRGRTEYSNVETGDMGFLEPMYRDGEVRKIAKEVTAQIRGSQLVYLPNLSSYRAFGSGSSTRYSSDLNYHRKYSSLGSTEAILNMEVERRLSERRERARRYEEMSEMVAYSCRRSRSGYFDVFIGPHGPRYSYSSSCRAEWDGLLGIGNSRDSSTSSSLPPMNLRNESDRAAARREALAGDRNLMHKDGKNIVTRMEAERNLGQKEHLSSRKLKIIRKSSSKIKVKKDLIGKHAVDSQMLEKNDASTSSMADTVADAEDESSVLFHNQEDSYLQEELSAVSDVTLQSPKPNLETSECSKETDQPSPVSVLDVPSLEDVPSNTKGFLRVSKDLEELKTQLQLTEMESRAAYPELPTPELNSKISEVETSITPENWKFSYITDVLTLSDFLHMWNFPERDLDPLMFDDLEKKYGEDTAITKSERRLLFDQINHALMEVYGRFEDSPYPWVNKLISRRNNFKQKKKNAVKNELSELLAAQETMKEVDISEKLLVVEMYWKEHSAEEIDAIVWTYIVW